jgi:RHH-type rel operon transcriptional repressor/antitoxin RelB
MLAIRLPEQVEQRLASLAERTGRTKTFYAKEAILIHLEELEELYLAGEVLERIKRGEERIYTFEEVKARHGLAD